MIEMYEVDKLILESLENSPFISFGELKRKSLKISKESGWKIYYECCPTSIYLAVENLKNKGIYIEGNFIKKK